MYTFAKRIKFGALSLVSKEKQWSGLQDDVLVMAEFKKKNNRNLRVHPMFLRGEVGEFNTMIQELKYCPVKFHQNFRMSAGHVEGLLRQLAPRWQRERTNDSPLSRDEFMYAGANAGKS